LAAAVSDLLLGAGFWSFTHLLTYLYARNLSTMELFMGVETIATVFCTLLVKTALIDGNHY